MQDEWSKKLPDGRTVVYTSDIVAGTGGVITAKIEYVIQTTAVKVPLTREDVEAEFRNISGGASRAVQA
jgi:glutamate dehydrogenase/leucine dehydrogenase